MPTNTAISTIILSVIMMLNKSILALQPLTTSQVLHLSTVNVNKLPVFLNSTFSTDSDVTVVVDSCENPTALAVTLNSFFHYNTYQLKQIIIFERCSIKEQQIWALLPLGSAHLNPQRFRIFFASKMENNKKGQISLLENVFKKITSKYMFYLPTSWVQIGSYGLIERMVDILQFEEQDENTVSQVVVTYRKWKQSTHLPSKIRRTNHKTIYFGLKLNPDLAQKDSKLKYENAYSFDPHLVNINSLYSDFQGKQIAKQLKQISECQYKDQECMRNQLGKYMLQNGYQQVYLQLNEGQIYQYLYEEELNNEDMMKLEQVFVNYEEKEKIEKLKFGTKISDKKQKNEKNEDELSNLGYTNMDEMIKQSDESGKKYAQLLLLILVLIILFLIKTLMVLVLQCCDVDSEHDKNRKTKLANHIKNRYQIDDHPEDDEHDQQSCVLPNNRHTFFSEDAIHTLHSNQSQFS